MIRVVIADDHPMMRRALAEAMTSALGAAVEVSEAGSFADAEGLLSGDPPPALLLLDLTMPGMNGFAGLATLRGTHPEIPVVIVSASEDPSLIRRAIEFGAAGYIPKSLPLGIGERPRLAHLYRGCKRGCHGLGQCPPHHRMIVCDDDAYHVDSRPPVPSPQP